MFQECRDGGLCLLLRFLAVSRRVVSTFNSPFHTLYERLGIVLHGTLFAIVVRLEPRGECGLRELHRRQNDPYGVGIFHGLVSGFVEVHGEAHLLLEYLHAFVFALQNAVFLAKEGAAKTAAIKALYGIVLGNGRVEVQDADRAGGLDDGGGLFLGDVVAGLAETEAAEQTHKGH